MNFHAIFRGREQLFITNPVFTTKSHNWQLIESSIDPIPQLIITDNLVLTYYAHFLRSWLDSAILFHVPVGTCSEVIKSW